MFIRRRWQSVPPAPRLTRVLPGLLVPEGCYYLLASAPWVVVFGIVPLSLYVHSGEAWAFDPELMLRLAGLGLIAFVATVALLRLIAVRFVQTTKALSISLFCLGVYMLFAHVYAPLAIGPLDGGAAKSDEPLSYTLLESILLVAAILLFHLLWRARGLVMAGLFVGTLWLVALSYVLAALWLAEDAGAEARLAETNSHSLSSSGSCGVKSNVYHIVLDALATDAYLEVIDSKGWAEEFDGFGLFFNNISNYLITRNSMASYLSGTIYHFGDIDDWREARAEGLFRHLAESSFGIWMYAWKSELRNPYVDVFRSTVGIYRERIGVLDGELYDFLSVWLTSLAPNVLTNEVRPVAANLADPLFTLLTSTRWRDKERLNEYRAGDAAALAKAGFHPAASPLLLEQVALDEAGRQPNCQYVYAHAMLPHGPYVLDGHCRYVGEWRSRPEKVSHKQAYMPQVECALRKVIDFLHVLKRLNRYDAATIVLHGDHGTWLRFRNSSDNSAVRALRKPRQALLARAQALLMVKRPHAQHRLDLVMTPTQLIDVYPTIFDLLGLELQPAEVHGRSVYASDASPREARFAHDPENWFGPNLIEVRIDDPSDLVTSNLTVVGPANDPKLWPEEVRRAAEAGASSVASGIRSR